MFDERFYLSYLIYGYVRVRGQGDLWKNQYPQAPSNLFMTSKLVKVGEGLRDVGGGVREGAGTLAWTRGVRFSKSGNMCYCLKIFPLRAKMYLSLSQFLLNIYSTLKKFMRDYGKFWLDSGFSLGQLLTMLDAIITHPFSISTLLLEKPME